MITRFVPALLLVFLMSACSSTAQVQEDRMDRITVNDQQVFLNGGNIAWIHFANDIGPNETRLDLFEDIFREVNENGGNSMRMWLHTTGAHTPEFDGFDVIGPGENTIDDLRDILDLAYEYDVALMLCLWSFDMLRIRNGREVTDRALAILTDEEKTQKYIDNALVPMVEELKGHPAILAWEIFNEPEGMSVEFGWEFNRHVPMYHIQKFINRTAGAIRRTDPDVQITNGAWSFRVLSDKAPSDKHEGNPTEPRRAPESLTVAEVKALKEFMTFKYEKEFTLEDALEYYNGLQDRGEHKNYYSDEALIWAGGDEDGYLDFYTVHYYTWGGTDISPFHKPFEYWELDKPTAVAEFYFDDMFGVAPEDLFQTLYDNGYAGALGWQWFDHWADREGIAHNWPLNLQNMKTLQELHPEAVKLKLKSAE